MSVVSLIKALEGTREVLLLYPDNMTAKNSRINRPFKCNCSLNSGSATPPENLMVYTLILDNIGSQGNRLKV